MATYLKRTSKLFDLSLSGLSAEVHLRDLICPVCRGILIEPVTLPCTHNLCLRCLKGTFEHNSLSCPLCRLRVGSWLRTATKSETLVNHGLWELIRTKFPKEVEDKHNGEERDLGLVDADFATNRILSAAGEIHREYEVQLQMAEEEMRRRRHAEQIASEALIQKIRVEEQQQLLAQLAQDQLLAKTLVKKQIVEKQKETAKCYSGCLNTSMSNYSFDASKFNIKITHVNNVQTSQAETAQVENRTNLSDSIRGSSELRRTNMVLLHKIHTDKHCKVKMNASSTYKDYCPKQSTTYNTAVTRALKHQMVSKFIQPCISNYNMDPGCSTSRAYVTETKEELRVPSDVVNSKKKSLGIEVCMTHGPLDSNRTADDERIGSAESSGSHDSINQEIHHFKPIKTVPRTPLKISSDGKSIEPKLLRVIPIMKRIINAVPKPPSPTHMKRIIGCSWSAFREVRQDAKEKLATNNIDMGTGTSIEQKASTSLSQSQTFFNKSSKLETNNARFDFIPEPSYDNNKNYYTKDTNKTINSTKVSKKLSSNDELDTRKTRKSWRTNIKNGILTKSNRYKNASSSRRRADFSLDVKDEDENDSSDSNSPFDKTSVQNDEIDDDDDVAVENIAERIKKRKVDTKKKTSKPKMESDARSKRSVRKRVLSMSINKSSDRVSSSRESVRLNRSSMLRSKRRRMCNSQSNTEHTEKNESFMDATTSSKVISGLKRSARNVISTRVSSKRRNSELNGMRDKYDYDSPPESCDETEECVSEENDGFGISEKKEFSDEEVIEEQQRMERLLLQERQDFELARRLQAKYDEMERIAGRTRRSRRAVENVASVDVTDLHEIDTARVVHKVSGATRKRSIHVRRKSIVPNKKRGRPPKRVKQDEIRTR